MKFHLAIILITTCFVNLSAQTKPGKWQEHFSYRNVFAIDFVNSDIYCATEYAIFKMDTTDNSIEKISKMNFLSDFDIKTIKANPAQTKLLIAYSNSNIDLIDNDNVYNIPDLKIKAVQGDKSINNILFIGDNAYLSCGFGITVVNLKKKEISDTYFIGENAGNIEVFQLAFDGQYLWAATEKGILKADFYNSNLTDYNNWIQDTSIPDFENPVTGIIIFSGSVYAIQGRETGGYKLYKNNTNWQLVRQDLNRNTKLYSNETTLGVAAHNRIHFYNTSNELIKTISSFGDNWNPNVLAIAFAKNGTVWFGDKYSGLIKQLSDEKFKAIVPYGPFTNLFLNTIASGDYVYAVAGGKSPSTTNLWLPGYLYTYHDNKWRTQIQSNCFDFYSLATHPDNSNNVFVGSYGSGVIEYTGTELINHWKEDNSTLISMIPGDPYIRVTGLGFDSYKNLWTINSSTSPVCVKKPDNTWKSFTFKNTIKEKNTGSLIITSSNNIWIAIKNLGIFAVDYNGTIENDEDDEYKLFQVIDQEGAQVGNDVLSMAEDHNGNIWIGTNEGVAVYYNPDDFYKKALQANRIKITTEVHDTIETQYLLATEAINAITIDGANRKWIGTKNSGAFLMSEDGTQEILHFFTENSPLVSDNVLSIAVQEKTGEVFFATEKGMVSYRGDATIGKQTYSDVYVFPNPVRETFTGNITISGLISNSIVKITDITGNLVYETKSLGGQAIWNGNNFDGKRVKTGVYLVFCSNEDGSESHVTKLVFIN